MSQSNPLVPVILSGGSGSRLWPLSRGFHPKQFIALADEHTLLQATALRLSSLENAEPPIVVCNEEHRFMVVEQLQAVGVAPAAVLLEPVGRNTAPAIAAAAMEALAQSGEGTEPILLAMPADHVIRGEGLFADRVHTAIPEAAAGKLVAFGVTPTYAESGYGYIEAGPPTGRGGTACIVRRFVEKPSVADAAAYIQAGGWYWNSGIFLFGAARCLAELGVHGPPILEAVRKAHADAVPDLGFLRLGAVPFAECPAVSVDHAVMEHTREAVVVPLQADWSDIGSWASLMAMAERDAAGNSVQGDVILQDVRDTYVLGGDRLVAGVGVEGLIIVDTADAVLVVGRDAAQDVKQVAQRLQDDGRDEFKSHRKVYRPWGSYDPVSGGDGFKVKHITVNPGQRLSLQAHSHRAEHWIVVRGSARVTRGEETFMLSEDQSTYIPAGVRHRLENPGTTPVELIEVQSGSYLGEDDIVRFEDAYGRAGKRTQPDQ